MNWTLVDHFCPLTVLGPERKDLVFDKPNKTCPYALLFPSIKLLACNVSITKPDIFLIALFYFLFHSSYAFLWQDSHRYLLLRKTTYSRKSAHLNFCSCTTTHVPKIFIHWPWWLYWSINTRTRHSFVDAQPKGEAIISTVCYCNV